MRMATEAQLNALQAEIRALSQQIDAELRVRRGEQSLSDQQTSYLRRKLDELIESYNLLVAGTENLFESPIPWSAPFDMQQNELQDSTGWVRFQKHWRSQVIGYGGFEPASSAPSESKIIADGAGSVGVYGYGFPQAFLRYTMGSFSMPWDWCAESDIYIVYNWCASAGNPGDVVWELEYALGNQGAAFDNTTILELVDTASGVGLQMQRAVFGPIDMTGFANGAQVPIRIIRQGADVRDTAVVTSIVTSVEMFYQADGIGSHELFSKTDVPLAGGAGTGASGGGGSKPPEVES